MKKEFGKDNVTVRLMNALDLISSTDRSSIDVIIADNHFSQAMKEKKEILSWVPYVGAETSLLCMFDSSDNMDVLVSWVQSHLGFRKIGDFFLYKNRPMLKENAISTKINRMVWFSPLWSNRKDCSELGYLNGNRINDTIGYNTSDMLSDAAGAERHPGSKGLGLSMIILKQLGFPGAKVLDLFSGSATFAVASKLLGMNYIGSEIDKDTFTQAKIKFDYCMKKAKSDLWANNIVKSAEAKMTSPLKTPKSEKVLET